MKGTILGLVISTIAFGGSTAYLWHQLRDEQAQAHLVADANRRLNERVAELEKARLEVMNLRTGPGNPFIAGTFTQSSPDVHFAPPPADEADAKDAKAPRVSSEVVPFRGAPMPPAMIKMMRSQLKAQNRKTYFDLKDSLSLSDEQADKLVDLITQEQTAGMALARSGADQDQMRTQMHAERERLKNEIAELLGPTNAAAFEDYQKSMPARMEVAALAQQFDGAEKPLSNEQRARLISAMSEERASVPAPSWSNPGGSPEQMQKDYNAWQSDFEERMAARAQGILNSDQLTVYNEYAQFQREMREQMAAQGRFIRGTPAAGVATMIAPNVRMNIAPAPPMLPPQDQEKPE